MNCCACCMEEICRRLRNTEILNTLHGQISNKRAGNRKSYQSVVVRALIVGPVVPEYCVFLVPGRNVYDAAFYISKTHIHI